jgi:hypothetical protein
VEMTPRRRLRNRLDGCRITWETTALFIILMPFALPIMVDVGWAKLRNTISDFKDDIVRRRSVVKEDEYQRMRSSGVPEPLPLVRPRALSFLASERMCGRKKLGIVSEAVEYLHKDVDILSKTSPLLQLPTEIRLEIWKLVLGEQNISIFRHRGRVVHLKQGELDIQALEHHEAWPYPYAVFEQRGMLTALMKTSRLMLVSTLDCTHHAYKSIVIQNQRKSYIRTIHSAFGRTTQFSIFSPPFSPRDSTASASWNFIGNSAMIRRSLEMRVENTRRR